MSHEETARGKKYLAENDRQADLHQRFVKYGPELLEAAKHWSACDYPDEVDFRCDGCNAARRAVELVEGKE